MNIVPIQPLGVMTYHTVIYLAYGNISSTIDTPETHILQGKTIRLEILTPRNSKSAIFRYSDRKYCSDNTIELSHSSWFFQQFGSPNALSFPLDIPTWRAVSIPGDNESQLISQSQLGLSPLLTLYEPTPKHSLIHTPHVRETA